MAYRRICWHLLTNHQETSKKWPLKYCKKITCHKRETRLDWYSYQNMKSLLDDRVYVDHLAPAVLWALEAFFMKRLAIEMEVKGAFGQNHIRFKNSRSTYSSLQLLIKYTSKTRGLSFAMWKTYDQFDDLVLILNTLETNRIFLISPNNSNWPSEQPKTLVRHCVGTNTNQKD